MDIRSSTTAIRLLKAEKKKSQEKEEKDVLVEIKIIYYDF